MVMKNKVKNPETKIRKFKNKDHSNIYIYKYIKKKY